MYIAKLSQSTVLSKACLSCICSSSLDQVLGIFCVLLKISYWLRTLTLNSFAFYDSRGSDDEGKYQEVLFFYSAPDTILKLLQSPETQGIKYKKEIITTFRIPSTPFCPKSSQNPTDDAFFSCFYNDIFCKGTTLGSGLVTWVGSHLRAVISLIAFLLFPFLSHDWHVVWSCIPNIRLCENTS